MEMSGHWRSRWKHARLAVLACIAAGLALAGCSSFDTAQKERTAAASKPALSEQQQVVDRARTTIDAAKTDPAFGNAPDLLRRARGVVIVPGLIKGGFFVGAEGGNGVLVGHDKRGWSDPAFYTLASGSFGLQIGLEAAQVVMFVMTDKGLDAMLRNEFKFGAQAGLAVVVLGSNVQAGSTTALNADIIVWATAQGAYAGITLEGSYLRPRDDYNKEYYGKPVTPREIVIDRKAHNPGSNALRTALGS